MSTAPWDGTTYAGRAAFTPHQRERGYTETGSFAGIGSPLTLTFPANADSKCGSRPGIKKLTLPGTIALTPDGTINLPHRSCTDTFNNDAGGFGWGTNGNWSRGSVPGPGDYACIPSSIAQQVVFASYSGSIKGLEVDNPGGLAFNNGNLELTSGASSIANIATGNAQLTLDAGVTLALTGVNGNLGLGAFDLDGPGTLLIPSGNSVDMAMVQMQLGVPGHQSGDDHRLGAGTSGFSPIASRVGQPGCDGPDD